MSDSSSPTRQAPVKVGHKFYYLTVISEPFRVHMGSRNYKGGLRTVVECQCVCGTKKTVRVDGLGFGKKHTKSCGCKRIEMRTAKVRTHGKSHTPLYELWLQMRCRCRNLSRPGYGAKGITVCGAWQDFPTFERWANANGYRLGLTIDRKEVDGNYEPSNCEWVTRVENSRRQTRARDETIAALRKENAVLKLQLDQLTHATEVHEDNPTLAGAKVDASKP